MGLFGSKPAKVPQIRVLKQGAGSRVLEFSEFMDQDMKKRIKSGALEWMDKVNIFESFYIPKRESEGWKLIKGNYKSSSTDDRFKATWQVGDEVINASYNDGESTVTERLKKSKN
jgi:hypothetical protein